MKTVNAYSSKTSDWLRQVAVLVAAPLIWIASSLGIFLESARSPSEFSALSDNLLVPQPFAFSIWFPIFLGILAYAIIQALRVNQRRALFRETGWWIAAGLWGIVAWGLATAYLPDSIVELAASLIFIPTMIALVMAMIKLYSRKESLDTLEKWFVLVPISLIAGWCSLAVFVGLNGLIWSLVEPLGWSPIGTALSVLSLSIGWVLTILIRGAKNPVYAFPVIWGLSFLVLRHLSDGGIVIIATTAILGIGTILVAIWPILSTKNSNRETLSPAE